MRVFTFWSLFPGCNEQGSVSWLYFIKCHYLLPEQTNGWLGGKIQFEAINSTSSPNSLALIALESGSRFRAQQPRKWPAAPAVAPFCRAAFCSASSGRCLWAIRSVMGRPPLPFLGLRLLCALVLSMRGAGELVLGTCSICPAYGRTHAAICLRHCSRNTQKGAWCVSLRVLLAVL